MVEYKFFVTNQLILNQIEKKVNLKVRIRNNVKGLK